MFVLRFEDIYAGCDCGECSCWSPSVWEVVGVFTTKAKAEKYIADRVATGSYYRADLYDIEEVEVDMEA